MCCEERTIYWFVELDLHKKSKCKTFLSRKRMASKAHILMTRGESQIKKNMKKEKRKHSENEIWERKAHRENGMEFEDEQVFDRENTQVKKI